MRDGAFAEAVADHAVGLTRLSETVASPEIVRKRSGSRQHSMNGFV
jgi:hypothetical protein